MLYQFYTFILIQKYDKNGDGVLGADEVTQLAKDLGYAHVTAKVIKDLINSVDKNGDGVISFDGKYPYSCMS